MGLEAQPNLKRTRSLRLFFAVDADHPLVGVGVLRAELRLLAASCAEVHPRGAPWVAAERVLEVGHTSLGVLRADFHFVAANHAEVRPRGAPWMDTRLVPDVDHTSLGVLRAEFRFVTANHAEVRPRGAPWVAALLPTTSHVLHARTR